MKSFFTLCSKMFFFVCFSTTALAAPPLFIAIAPTKQTVSYGATKIPIVLQYYLVSNLSNKSQKLTNFSFTSKSASANIKITSITNNCASIVPPQGGKGVCTINVNAIITGIQPPSHHALPPASYELKFTYGNGRATTLTSPPIVFSFSSGNQITSASRTFTFTNHCNYDVWLGINSGATNSIKPAPATPTDLQSCLNNNDCYPGSLCLVASVGLKHCFWANPPTANGQYKLTAKGGKNKLTLPVYDNGIEPVWSGGIAGRTGCTNSTCQTGDCVDPLRSGHGGACELTKGFTAPVSTAEFTLLGSNTVVYTNTTNGNTAVDTYDSTVINGITTPISMTPANGKWGGRSKPYSCGAAGASTNTQSSAACNWNGFVVPDYTYVFVKYNAGAANCTSDATCGGLKCGSSFNPTGSIVESGKCGTPIGYWTADGICAKQANYINATNKIHCVDVVGPGAATQTELYGCTGNPYKNSCYTVGSVSGQCCGCVDWYKIPGINVPAYPTTASCNKISSTPWVSDALPKLEWLKKACPNAYVYPFDDASSTFTCQALNSNKINVVNYNIDFCPVT